MKNKIISFWLLISLFPFFNAQKIIFKDKNFEKAIIENFDLNKDGNIVQSEADHVENLFLVGKGITSTEDLPYFKNAKMIVLDDNKISVISVKNMGCLRLFSCTRCKISSFSAENLKNLTSLYLDDNTIQNILLKSTPAITQLTVSLNKIKAIDISGLRNLKNINLEHNFIRKLDISQNLNLETLNIKQNPIREDDIKKGAKDVTIFGFHQQ